MATIWDGDEKKLKGKRGIDWDYVGQSKDIQLFIQAEPNGPINKLLVKIGDALPTE